MKKPSFEKFNYSLRPAKNIERKMFCEVFARLSRISPLRSYRYIGFGANTFVDFTLFHQRLGITDMVTLAVIKWTDGFHPPAAFHPRKTNCFATAHGQGS